MLFECGQALYGPLLDRGFLIRRCENYVGLDSRWYRVAVRTHGENAEFLEALAAALGCAGTGARTRAGRGCS